MNASPVELPATQNTAERQDTDIRNIRTGPLTELAAFESMLTGALQVLPLKVTTFERVIRHYQLRIVELSASRNARLPAGGRLASACDGIEGPQRAS